MVVRRVATGSIPFTWELRNGDSVTPVQVSLQRFRSMQDAYVAGQAGLADYLSQRLAKSVRPTPRRILATPDALDLPDADDLLDEDDYLETEGADQDIETAESARAAD